MVSLLGGLKKETLGLSVVVAGIGALIFSLWFHAEPRAEDGITGTRVFSSEELERLRAASGEVDLSDPLSAVVREIADQVNAGGNGPKFDVFPLGERFVVAVASELKMTGASYVSAIPMDASMWRAVGGFEVRTEPLAERLNVAVERWDDPAEELIACLGPFDQESGFDECSSNLLRVYAVRRVAWREPASGQMREAAWAVARLDNWDFSHSVDSSGGNVPPEENDWVSNVVREVAVSPGEGSRFGSPIPSELEDSLSADPQISQFALASATNTGLAKNPTSGFGYPYVWEFENEDLPATVPNTVPGHPTWGARIRLGAASPGGDQEAELFSSHQVGKSHSYFCQAAAIDGAARTAKNNLADTVFTELDRQEPLSWTLYSSMTVTSPSTTHVLQPEAETQCRQASDDDNRLWGL